MERALGLQARVKVVLPRRELVVLVDLAEPGGACVEQVACDLLVVRLDGLAWRDLKLDDVAGDAERQLRRSRLLCNLLLRCLLRVRPYQVLFSRHVVR